MERTKRSASVEFLEFLADISNPATGEISLERLAEWLAIPALELSQRLRQRGEGMAWPRFAEEILAVLDAVHDSTCDLATSVHWYKFAPISCFHSKTADQVVTEGGARLLIMLIRRGEVGLPGVGSPQAFQADQTKA
jgi:hypothetical protein